MRVEVMVMPRQGILDPQGQAVKNSLRSLGFESVSEVRVGKYIVVELAASTVEEARRLAEQMCQQLLANTVIEDYFVRVEGE